MNQEKQLQTPTVLEVEESNSEALSGYEPPVIFTYRGEELLGMLGPAQACSFAGAVVAC